MSILLQKMIRNLDKAFCLVLMVSVLRMMFLYIQEKDFRISDLQNELRYESNLPYNWVQMSEYGWRHLM